MDSPDVPRAISAAIGIAAALGLPADRAVILHDSNALTLRLMPGDVVARVTHAEGQVAAQRVELERARAFVRAGCPVGVPEPSVAPEVRTRDGFAVTFWRYYEPTGAEVASAAYASALAELHAGMRTLAIAAPGYGDRIADAERVAEDRRLSPRLGDEDRALLGSTLRAVRRSIEARTTAQQLLHGEPHPGNLLATRHGPLFIDFETVCRGPVEFDLAYAPEAVIAHYPRVDPPLLDDCRLLVIAMLAAWRWRVGDGFPDGGRWGEQFLRTLRAGPPWPSLEGLTRRFGAATAVSPPSPAGPAGAGG